MRAICPVQLILDLLISISSKNANSEVSHYAVLYNLIASILDADILLSTLFWNTLSVRVSLFVRPTSHHTITYKIILFYILIIAVLDSRRKDTRFWIE
jgi:hypothetical protein